MINLEFNFVYEGSFLAPKFLIQKRSSKSKELFFCINLSSGQALMLLAWLSSGQLSSAWLTIDCRAVAVQLQLPTGSELGNDNFLPM